MKFVLLAFLLAFLFAAIGFFSASMVKEYAVQGTRSVPYDARPAAGCPK